MSANTEIKLTKITRYLPRLKMLSIVMRGTIGDYEITYRKKRILTKRLERKLT